MSTRTTEGALGEPARGLLVASIAATLVVAFTLPVAAQSAYPLTLVDDEGTEVTIEAHPERIISLSPSNTEVVYAIGAGDRLVGRANFDDYPPEVVDVTPVVEYTGVDLEQVVALEPDVVLAQGAFFNAPDDIAALRDLGIPVVVIHAPDVHGVLDDIELIGAAVGSSVEAADVVAQMQADFDTIAAEVAGTDGVPSVFYEIGVEPEIYAPAPGSFLADMIALAGGEPIMTGDPALWSIPFEELLVADPEVIVLGDAMWGQCPEQVAERPGWDAMTAVVNGDIRPVDDVTITRPGPRLAAGLANLARAIHPELELADFPPGPELCASE